MPQLTISEEQVLELLQQLSPEGKRKAFEFLRSELMADFLTTMKDLSEHLHQRLAEWGIDIDSLSDDEWEVLEDDIVHKANSGSF